LNTAQRKFGSSQTQRHYDLPGDREARIAAFAAEYNPLRYDEAIGKLTPADVSFGQGQTIPVERERIRQTIAKRRLPHQRQAA